VRAETNVAERVLMTVLELSGKRRAIDLTPARTSSFLSYHQRLFCASVHCSLGDHKHMNTEGQEMKSRRKIGRRRRGKEIGRGEEEGDEGEG
jgi:hypothetical protein